MTNTLNLSDMKSIFSLKLFFGARLEDVDGLVSASSKALPIMPVPAPINAPCPALPPEAPAAIAPVPAPSKPCFSICLVESSS